MSMVTKLLRVITFCKELPSIKLHDSLMTWSWEVTIQLNISYLYLQKTDRYVTSQVADFVWEASTLKVRRLFDHVTDMKPKWQIERVVSPLSQDLWSLNLAGWWICGGGSERKLLNRHQPLLLFFLFVGGFWLCFISCYLRLLWLVQG